MTIETRTHPADGSTLLVEPETHPRLDRRAFRETPHGFDWCHLSDFEENGARARFYHYAPRELPASLQESTP